MTKNFHLLLAFLILALGMRVSGQELTHLSTVKLGAFDEGAAEMVDYDPATKRIFSINEEKKNVSVIDLNDPSAAELTQTLDISEFGKSPTCVSTNGTLVAVSVAADDKQARGKVVFFTTAGKLVGSVASGPLPDNLSFTPDGNLCVVANEGEPDDEYTIDPEGSVTVIDVSSGKLGKVTQVSFADLKPDENTRIFGPGASVAQDLEPEFVAYSGDSKTAWVVCQENNAVVTVDLKSMKATGVKGLGSKDYSKDGNGFDASNESDSVEIRTWPVKGLYQPDGIESFVVAGETFIATANEGDAREYLVEHDNGEEEEFFVEETRVAKLKLDPKAFPNAKELQDEKNLGRMKTTTTMGDTDGDGDFDEIYGFGGRSFSIWDSDWNLVFDSGDDFETVTAETLGEGFNSTNDESAFKDRSDDKGPEPEAVVLGEIDGKKLAFIGLERVSGVMIYDVSVPAEAKFISYHNHRDFSADPETAEAGDLGPEDLEFIPASHSANGKNLLVVASEVSGTISVFEIK